MTDTVRIVEVGPRDGLQNEAVSVDTATRIEFIRKLRAAGLTTIETGSFVSPKWVPQMAGSGDVLRAVMEDTANYPVLVPNEEGLVDALAAGAREVAVFASASEAFSHKNINCSIAESIERFRPVLERALDSGLRVRGYVSCVMGCPYEGAVPLSRVAQIASRLHELGCYEISLGDTIGTGTPRLARELVRTVSGHVPVAVIAAHFHDTYGQAMANLYAAMEEGARVVDSAAGGLGGCPYAQGASGNAATEGVVYMLEGMGVETGVDVDRLLEAIDLIATAINCTPQSAAYKALKGHDVM